MSTFEEQFAALFGKTTDGKKISDKKYMKYGGQGESFSFVITGDMQSTDQVDQNGKTKFMVKTGGGKTGWEPKAEGSFSEDLEHFKPQPDRQFPVHVVAHKKANGEPVDGFEPFDTVWELRAGNRMEKLEEAMMEAQLLLGNGTRVIEKLLDKNSKPYKYAIKLAPPKE
ncbi:MAG TPA: hypothetical protein VIY48_14450 [Candidatus Paceibacterota bacterium]